MIITSRYSQEEIDKAITVLKKHERLADALEEISKVIGREVTDSSLRSMFYRRRDQGYSTAGSYLRNQGATPEAVMANENEELDDEATDSAEDEGPFEAHMRAREAKASKIKEKELLELLREAKERQSFIDSFQAPIRPLQIPRREKSSGGLREGTAIVLASDWHVEEVVDPVKIAGRNAYNLEIAKVRASRFFSSVRWLQDFMRTEYHLRDLVLWLGGDLMTGYIHEEYLESNECSPVETILELRNILIGGIDFLLKDPKLENLKIPCSFGNHGRTTVKRRSKTGAENSYEWLLYNILAWHYEKEPRVEFGIDKSSHQYLEAYDFRLHFHHGDTVRYWGGLGGLSIPLNKRIPKWDNVLRSDYHHVGHFHQAIDLGRVLVNGSLIGYNEYAQDQGCDYEPPQQLFYMLDAKRGKCLSTPIWVDEEPPHKGE